ncbi:MAG: hypothetical protein ACUVUH_08595, partial [bacterium]
GLAFCKSYPIFLRFTLSILGHSIINKPNKKRTIARQPLFGWIINVLNRVVDFYWIFVIIRYEIFDLEQQRVVVKGDW